MTLAAGADVVLKPFERRHLAATLRWANDPELAKLLDRPRRIDPDEHEQWFQGLASRTDTLYFAIEQGGRHIGNVWLANIDPRHHKAEVRIVVDKSAVERGCGGTALDLVANHALGTMRLNRVYAYVLGFNPRARRAFEKAGFALEGTLRRDRADGESFVDVFVLGRLNDQFTR